MEPSSSYAEVQTLKRPAEPLLEDTTIEVKRRKNDQNPIITLALDFSQLTAEPQSEEITMEIQRQIPDQNPPSFLGLPQEVRDKIYYCCLEDSNPHGWNTIGGFGWQQTDELHGNVTKIGYSRPVSLRLLGVSRNVNKEFQAAIDFTLKDQASTTLGKFFDSIRPFNTDRIRRMFLRYPKREDQSMLVSLRVSMVTAYVNSLDINLPKDYHLSDHAKLAIFAKDLVAAFPNLYRLNLSSTFYDRSRSELGQRKFPNPDRDSREQATLLITGAMIVCDHPLLKHLIWLGSSGFARCHENRNGVFQTQWHLKLLATGFEDKFGDPKVKLVDHQPHSSETPNLNKVKNVSLNPADIMSFSEWGSVPKYRQGYQKLFKLMGVGVQDWPDYEVMYECLPTLRRNGVPGYV